MNVEINPTGREALYLDSLNQCFPGWGAQAQYDWAFRRTAGGPAADLMFLREGEELIAGSAVSYRRIRTHRGPGALVGIMTGSWTLPAARGRGAFTRIIEESVALTRAHGGAVLLAFVTETNASFRRLEAAGSTLFPTRYVSSPPGLAAPAAAFTERAATPGDAPRFLRGASSETHFEWPTEADWAGQLLGRPVMPGLVEANGMSALVETHGDFDRVQAISVGDDAARAEIVAACLHRATTRGKRLFLFESNAQRAKRWETMGLTAAPGYLTALGADEAALSVLIGTEQLSSLAPWSIDSGERM